MSYYGAMSINRAQAISDDRVTWGDRLRRLRLNRGLDQAEMAEAIGVSKPSVGKYELLPNRPRSAALIENSVELRFGPDAARFLRDPQPTGCRPRHLVLVPQLSEVA